MRVRNALDRAWAQDWPLEVKSVQLSQNRASRGGDRTPDRKNFESHVFEKGISVVSGRVPFLQIRHLAPILSDSH